MLLILGMHRSGTSLCARTANLLGARLGDDPLMSRPDNPRGYFEDRTVVGMRKSSIPWRRKHMNRCGPLASLRLTARPRWTCAPN